MPEFAPEWSGSYLLALQKPSGGIRIAPVTSGDGLRDKLLFKLHSKQPPKRSSTLIQISSSWPRQKKVLLTVCISSMLAYSDKAFTSAEDAEDPMVIVKLDISNAFGSLCARLVLDVLSGKSPVARAILIQS